MPFHPPVSAAASRASWLRRLAVCIPGALLLTLLVCSVNLDHTEHPHNPPSASDSRLPEVAEPAESAEPEGPGPHSADCCIPHTPLLQVQGVPQQWSHDTVLLPTAGLAVACAPVAIPGVLPCRPRRNRITTGRFTLATVCCWRI